MDRVFRNIGRIGLGATFLGGFAEFCLFDGKLQLFFCLYLFLFIVIVDGGTRAVIFDKISGVQQKVVGEGTHIRIPFLQVICCFCLQFVLNGIGYRSL